MKKSQIRNLFAGTAVAALGTLGSVRPAQADIISSIAVNCTSTNITQLTADGIVYPAKTPATLNLTNINTVTGLGGMCDAVITTPTGTVTTPEEPFYLGSSVSGATVASISAETNVSPYSADLELWALSSNVAPGYVWNPYAASSWAQLFTYVNANSPYTQYDSNVYTSDNSPDFDITSITMVVPEPSSAALLGLASAGLLARRQRKAAPAMAGL